MIEKKINIGLFGWGRLAKKIFNILQQSQKYNLVAVSSNSVSDDNFYKEIKNKNITFYNNHNNLLDNKDIDTVYILTTNNLHKELILKASYKKKNIICEKPACLNFPDFVECFESIKKNNIFFCEGLMYLHHSQIQKLIELLGSNTIGKIKKIACSFGFKVGFKLFGMELKKINYESRLFNPILGGGAINDLGCYPLSFSLVIMKFLFKDFNINNYEFKKKYAKSNVDEEAKGYLKVSNNIEIFFEVSIRRSLKNNLMIYGDKGVIELTNPWGLQNNSKIKIHTNGEVIQHTIDEECSIYESQLNNIFKAIKNNFKELSFPYADLKLTLDYLNLLTIWKSKNENF